MVDLRGGGAEPLREEDPRRIGPIPLVGRLGSGGMGRVYLGVHEGRYAAVKQVLPLLAEDHGFLRHFGHELDNLARLPEEATAPLLAAGRDATPPWLATAYVPGLTLHQAVEQHGGGLPADSLWLLLRGAAAALTAVHARNMVHRDLKPSNVMVTLDGVTLIDFGVARAADQSRLTKTGMVVGTPAYMSPEQATAGRLTGATDVFALGSLVAFAACGRPPFGDGSGLDLLYRIVHDTPDLAALRACDPDLAEVVAACLDKDPEGRPTASELVASAEERGPSEPPWWPGALTERLTERAAFARAVPAAGALGALHASDATHAPDAPHDDAARPPGEPAASEPPGAADGIRPARSTTAGPDAATADPAQPPATDSPPAPRTASGTGRATAPEGSAAAPSAPGNPPGSPSPSTADKPSDTGGASDTERPSAPGPPAAAQARPEAGGTPPGAPAGPGGAEPPPAAGKPDRAPVERKRRTRVLTAVVPVVVAVGTATVLHLLPYSAPSQGAHAAPSFPPAASTGPTAPAPPATGATGTPPSSSPSGQDAGATPSSGGQEPDGERGGGPGGQGGGHGPGAASGAGSGAVPGTGTGGGPGGGSAPGSASGSATGAGSADSGSTSGGQTSASGGGSTSGSSTTSGSGSSGPGSTSGSGSGSTSGSGSASGGTSGGGSTPAPPSGALRYRNAANGTCLISFYGAAGVGDCADSTAQWTVSATSGGAFRLVNRQDGGCLSANLLGQATFVKGCDSHPARQWRAGSDGTLRSVSNGGCLDLGTGGGVATVTCVSGEASQRWSRR